MTGRIVGHGAKAVYYLDGNQVTRRTFYEAFPVQTVADSGQCALSSVPVHASDGLAVHPDQVVEAMESAKRKGVPTEFLPDGRPIMRSRAHQKAYLKAYNFHNRDGGYGD